MLVEIWLQSVVFSELSEDNHYFEVCSTLFDQFDGVGDCIFYKNKFSQTPNKL